MNAKILYGVCGIGMGHTMRQLPIIEHLAAAHRVVIFAYGKSHTFLGQRFAGNARVSLEEVSVPFYVGYWDGLDFAATLARHEQFARDHFALNCRAMAQVQKLIGKPDLVISDYEPTCAQYGYSQNTPVVTIDQQSKYLVGKFPRELAGQTHVDEGCRLRMFFPKAKARIACTFFAVEKNPPVPGGERVLIAPSIITETVRKIRRRPDPSGKTVLVYISSQREFVQDLAEATSILSGQADKCFHVFLPADMAKPQTQPANVKLYQHGDAEFAQLLATANGVITTAGHSLLSELMYLGLPPYVIPLPVYEQQMNARCIHSNGFGISAAHLEAETLASYLSNLCVFTGNIKADKTILLKGSGHRKIISFLTRNFLSAA